MIVIEMLRGTFKVPWQLQPIIEEIKQIIYLQNIKVQHYFREGNQVAHALAKWSNRGQHTIFFGPSKLPKEAFGPYILDKLKL